ncbi:helix-turn-helix transcriptional regulator [Actinomadura terrae]|uniref:helix-turn-helix transcriptional regulator n=1 Tax=Actinomadura terrae TaxID=604353 RepID=UPI001FA73E48|nr:WYL domain-containing protein [Actinomadura terrae]
MPTSSAPSTSRRLLSLLSLLQARRDWPGHLLAERLEVSPRTVRRDVDRLRELGYPVRAIKGPDGGYRLDAGAQLPPLLFDDDQAIALAIALRGAPQLGAGIEEDAARALATISQVMPARLRARLDAFEPTVVGRPAREGDGPARTAVLLAIAAALNAREELRFDYASSGRTSPARTGGRDVPAPRSVQPHHLLARSGRWYLIGWEPAREDWRVYRADRITPRTPNGPRFVPRELPGGDPAAFLAARFKGSDGGADRWPCQGEVILHLPAGEVVPFAHDGIVTALGEDRCRVRLGAWSWPGLAAALARFDAPIDVVDPPELRTAFADLARRAAAAATPIADPSRYRT